MGGVDVEGESSGWGWCGVGGCWVVVGCVRVCVEGGEGKRFAPAGKGVGQGEKGEAGWWCLGNAGVLCGMRASHSSRLHALPCMPRPARIITQKSPPLQQRRPRLKRGTFLRYDARGSTRHTHKSPSHGMLDVFHRCAGSERPISRTRLVALLALFSRAQGTRRALRVAQDNAAPSAAPINR